MKYMINPRYQLRNEEDKIVLLMKPSPYSSSSICILHPIYAQIVSFVDGCTIEEAANRAANTIKMPIEKIIRILNSLIENKHPILGYHSIFPENMLVKYKEGTIIRKYNLDYFKCNNLNLTLSRLKYPADIICNLTMKCKTSCIYCYANRQHHFIPMPIKKICSIIEEAKEHGVVSFKLIGGDIFLYPYWKNVLIKLKECGYLPCLSTKIPIKEDDIKFIKNILPSDNPLQISLDSLIPDHLKQILKISPNRYIHEMKNTFELLEKYKIPYIINSVICSINDNIEDMISIEKIVSKSNFLKIWQINAAKCSMYLPYKYREYRPSSENVLKLQIYFQNLQKTYKNIKIISPRVLKSHNSISQEKKETIFQARVACSGNASSMYILPDGKVTICEELYWHPHFILGDLMKNSINEVWNSEKAINLFHIKQKEISKNSPCSSCKEFNACHTYKHVCWRDIILAYGKDHWDFPDPFCPRAPKIEKEISMV